VQLLVRPRQPRIGANAEGVEAEVVSVELRPPESREVRRVAVVRADGKLLRVFVDDQALAVGDKVRVWIEDECEILGE
jgi:hypothetical protein